MKQQIEEVKNLFIGSNVQGCIVGSSMLDYFEEQDVDVFLYGRDAFVAAACILNANKMFTFLNKQEERKFNQLLKGQDVGFKKIGLISLKFMYNTCVPVNLVVRRNTYTIFDVLQNFDLDIIAQGIDIPTGQYLSLRSTTGMNCDWNRFNTYFYEANEWNVRRFIRQFARVIKYARRGYEMSKVVEKYIQLCTERIEQEVAYKTEKYLAYNEAVVEEFTLAKSIMEDWQSITDEQLEKLINLSANSGGVQIKERVYYRLLPKLL